MSARINIKGLDKLSARLSDMARRQIPFAASKAINDVANDVRTAVQAEMQKVFDRPTPYVIRSVQVRLSNKRELVAKVAMVIPGHAVGDNAPSSVRPQVGGGSRKIKGSEAHLIAAGILPPGKYLMPATGAKRDMFGNVPPSEYVRILSDLQAFQEGSFRRSAKMNKTVQSSLARQRLYYVKVANGIKIGIFKRVCSLGNSRKWSTVRDVPVFWFASKPSYTKRLYFHEVARAAAVAQIQRRFNAAWQYALASAR